jgi:hypothetical protein
MHSVLMLTLVLAGVAASGCSSPKTEKVLPSRGDTAKSVNQTGTPEGTTLKRNAAEMAAVVESVEVSGDFRYRLTVRLTSLAAAEGTDTPSEQGQRLVLSPGYVFDANGAVDPSNERNRRLMALRSARPGDGVKGTISLTPEKGWVILDVEPR